MQQRSILTLGPLIVDIITSPMERMLQSGEGVATSVGIHPGGCSFNVSADCAQIGGDQVAVTAVGAVTKKISTCYCVIRKLMCGRRFVKKYSERSTVFSRNTEKCMRRCGSLHFRVHYQ
jgi:sugar/nucleoside kinase (ribokinase family)